MSQLLFAAAAAANGCVVHVVVLVSTRATAAAATSGHTVEEGEKEFRFGQGLLFGSARDFRPKDIRQRWYVDEDVHRTNGAQQRNSKRAHGGSVFTLGFALENHP